MLFFRCASCTTTQPENSGGAMHQAFIVLSLAAFGLLSACAGGGHGRDINDPANSLVFGYVDRAGARTKGWGGRIGRGARHTEKPYGGTKVGNGIFIRI